jgi:hypothetical protein
MKNAIRLAVALVVLLVALTSCTLYNAINVGWTINSVTAIANHTIVDFTATNYGKYDLAGVNLLICVDLNNNGVYSVTEPAGWTPDFSLSQNQSYSSSIDISHVGFTNFGWATVISVDMDKPS